jgi:hypothetical protein
MNNSNGVTAATRIHSIKFTVLFSKLYKKDGKLELVSQGVAHLRELALDMGKEVELQEKIINELDREVEKTNEQLDQINARMKKTLEGVSISVLYLDQRFYFYLVDCRGEADVRHR